MAAPKDPGSSFVEAIESVYKAPEVGGGLGKDLPDGFPFSPPATHRVVETSEEGIKGATAYDYKLSRRVYTIFRPWGSCERCANEIAAEEVVLPPEGDYTCPHTQLSEYEEVMNKVLAGKLIKFSEREVDLRDGTIAVSLSWGEPFINHKRRRQEMKDARAAAKQSE